MDQVDMELMDQEDMEDQDLTEQPATVLGVVTEVAMEVATDLTEGVTVPITEVVIMGYSPLFSKSPKKLSTIGGSMVKTLSLTDTDLVMVTDPITLPFLMITITILPAFGI